MTGSSIDFAPPDASQQLSSRKGEFERLAPSGLGLVRTKGAFEVRAGKTKSDLKVQLGVESRRLGPVPVPTLEQSVTERVVLLDSLLYVTRSGNSSFVWVRPSMQKSDDSDQDI